MHLNIQINNIWVKDDLKKFKKLDVVTEVSPKFWFPNPITEAQIHILGYERTQMCYPINSLLNTGVVVTYASVWPAGTLILAHG